jgi:hypothetical protein
MPIPGRSDSDQANVGAGCRLGEKPRLETSARMTVEVEERLSGCRSVFGEAEIPPVWKPDRSVLRSDHLTPVA